MENAISDVERIESGNPRDRAFILRLERGSLTIEKGETDEEREGGTALLSIFLSQTLLSYM